VVAHLLASPLHTLVKRCGSCRVTWREGLIQSLFILVVISIFLLFVLCGGRDGDVAIGRCAGFTDGSCIELENDSKQVVFGGPEAL
jgi:hypothetical protein